MRVALDVSTFAHMYVSLRYSLHFDNSDKTKNIGVQTKTEVDMIALVQCMKMLMYFGVGLGVELIDTIQKYFHDDSFHDTTITFNYCA